MSTREWIVAVLAFLSVFAALLMYLPQIKVWSVEQPGSRNTFCALFIACLVWAACTDDWASLPPIIAFMLLFGAFLVTMHRRRRKVAVHLLIALSAIGALLNQQVSYAKTGGTGVEVEELTIASGDLNEAPLVAYNEADAIAQAEQLVWEEFGEFNPEIMEVDVALPGQELPVGQAMFAPAAAGWIVVIIILVVAGFIIYKIIRFCQKHFNPVAPPPTNNVPPVGIVAAAASPATSTNTYSSYNVIVTYEDVCTSSSCGCPEGTFQITAEVTDSGSNGPTMTVTGSQYLPPSQLVSFDRFADSLVPWGINLSTNVQAGVTGYARNGTAATPAEVPVSYVGSNTVVNPAPGTLVTSVLEFSRDLATWSAIATMTVPSGQKVIIEDSPGTSQAFYRFRKVEP